MGSRLEIENNRLLVEILAIQLFDHSFNPHNWSEATIGERDKYRDMARSISDTRNWEPYRTQGEGK